jgi:hypothetical protein
MSEVLSSRVEDLFQQSDAVRDIMALAATGLRWSAIVLTPKRASGAASIRAEIRSAGDEHGTLVIVAHKM